MNLKTLINSCCEEVKCLYDYDNGRVILSGDYYHDKIDEQIIGFISALSYLRIDYQLEEDIVLTPASSLFVKVGFQNFE